MLPFANPDKEPLFILTIDDSQSGRPSDDMRQLFLWGVALQKKYPESQPHLFTVYEGRLIEISPIFITQLL